MPKAAFYDLLHLESEVYYGNKSFNGEPKASANDQNTDAFG